MYAILIHLRQEITHPCQGYNDWYLGFSSLVEDKNE